MMPMEIAPGIYDVGATDWIVRDFHGYKTERGASYNSYLIVDEKFALLIQLRPAMQMNFWRKYAVLLTLPK